MQDLTTGSIARHLLKTTSFMLVTMIFQTLYFLVDLYWVGRLGKEAVAGVAVGGNLMFLVLAITQMLGVGTTTLISHAAGRKDRERAQLVFNQSQVLAVVVGVVFFVVAMSLRGWYADELAADTLTAVEARAYLGWFIPAMALQFGLVAMGAALRGIGLFKPGMIVQTTTVVVNMVLAPLLMFGWLTGHPMGVAGTSLASFVAVGVGTIWLSWYFLAEGSFLRFDPSAWRPRLRLWGRMLGIGLPAGAEFGLMGVYVVIVYVLTRPFGAAAQAGFGIGLRIVQSLFMPVVALGFAVAPVAGQNFGARLGERVRATFGHAARLAAGLMLLLTLACHIAPAAMIRPFSSDPTVIAVGEDYLRIVSWNFVASGLIFVASSMFQALGNTIPSLVTSSARLLIFALPVTLLARLPGFELRWIWYLSVAAVTLQMTANLLLLQRELRTRLTFEAAPGVSPAG
jgi:putative MATE family efflux protein